MKIILKSFILLSVLFSNTIYVPGDYSTIQEGIDASSDGDIVLVQAGTYNENINYNGKNIVVQGENRETTIIDGGSGNTLPAVKFWEYGYATSTQISGFKIQNYGNDGISILNGGSPKISNCIIYGVHGTDNAGGIYIGGDGIGSSVVVERCLIYGNQTTTSEGGGIRIASNNGSASAQIINCTITQNSPEGIRVHGSNTTVDVVNTIIYDNPIGITNLGTINITHSNIQGSYEGDGNIDLDPLFVDPESGDFHLSSDSPCIDAGDPNSPLDPDGSFSDMGAYPFQTTQPENNNYSLSFDGEDDYVLIAEASSYIQNSDASLMGWFKINDFDGLNPLFGFRNYPDDYCSMYAVMGTNGTIETMVYGNLQSFNSGHDANQWYHLAMVFNSQTETFNTYVNGELGSSIATPSSIFDCRDIDLLIGGMQIGNFETLNGSIDDVSLWDVSLTQDDIQAHMNTELSGDETGLAGYWNFNEGEGSILTDLSDNRIDGDIIGATWSDDGAPVMPGSIASLEVGLVQGYPNSEVSVPVHIDLMQESLSSLEISFSGFQDHMEFLDLELEGAMIGDAEWDVVLNNQEDLLLTLSYGANEISGEGVLFNLKFNIPEQAETDFVPIMIEQVQLDELDGSIEILNGGVQINAIVWGDVSQNGDVSGYDASLILKYLVGSEELDETQLHVADVTQDATISALDASAVAQYVVQLIDVLPLEDPSSISGGGEFYFRDTELIPGEMLEIPIELTNGENLLSFEFSAEYDESVFTVEEVIWSDLINHFTIEDNLVPGSINIAGMGTSPDGAEGTFGTIRLYVNPEFSDQNSSINLSYRINESVPVDNINIIIPNSSLGVDHTLTPKVFTLHQNYPNPFNPTTQIGYDLPQNALVSISIYDVMGRKIKSLSNGNQIAGYHSLQWDATNDIGEGVSAGMYIYTIQAGEYRSTKKMVLLK